uniref:Uncharacterized protein n=1 Tax=Myoviridae sp. ctLnO19 TaxID=2825085 RepID=A0A8S5P179_9CAUD|nr:MAG TPA: hypothetical protein [Myoviridae sp. ctLnO19]
MYLFNLFITELIDNSTRALVSGLRVNHSLFLFSIFFFQNLDKGILQ